MYFSLALAVWAALDFLQAAVTMGLLVISIPFIWRNYRMVITIDGADEKRELSIDRAHIETKYLKGAIALDEQQYRKLRTRDFDGLGDIGRMQRQQQFVSAVFRKATSTGVLLNPFKLKNLISAVFKTVKTDETLGQGDIVNLAKQIKNLSPSKMRTMTIPLGTSNGYAPGIGSVVIWDETLAPELFDRLRNDQAVVDQASPSPSAKNKSSASPSVIDKFRTTTASENPCGQVKY